MGCTFQAVAGGVAERDLHGTVGMGFVAGAGGGPAVGGGAVVASGELGYAAAIETGAPSFLADFRLGWLHRPAPWGFTAGLGAGVIQPLGDDSLHPILLARAGASFGMWNDSRSVLAAVLALAAGHSWGFADDEDNGQTLMLVLAVELQRWPVAIDGPR